MTLTEIYLKDFFYIHVNENRRVLQNIQGYYKFVTLVTKGQLIYSN